VAKRLAALTRAGIVGANLGKNKDTEDAASDYELGAARLAPLSDYLVINVSSPNTPGLRALQGRDQLEGLVGRTRAALTKVMPSGAPPLLLKIAPDLAWEDLADIAAVALAGGLDGLIVSNTTIARPDTLRSANAKETGGLSGAPLFESIIGVGGIASGSEAYAKIRAGASLVQVYSAMVYEGPALITRIKREMADLLHRDGFSTIAEAVGADHRGVGQ
jgi:dihydroorotate dehydrogenase